MRVGCFVVCAAVSVVFQLALGTAVASAATPVSGAVRVHVRVEAPDRTLFNGAVNASANGFSTDPVPGTACDELTVRSFAPSAPSAVTALDSALARAARGFWSDPFAFTWGSHRVGTRGLPAGVRPFSFGPELCRVGRWVSNPAAGYGWKLKVNNAATGPVSPTAPLAPGSTVLWYWSEPTTTRTLELDLPLRTISGRSVVGYVRVWDNATDQLVTPSLVRVAIAGKYIQPRADGSFRMRIRNPGLYVIGASAAGTARGSDVICVYKRRSGACGTRLRRR